jgi:ferritin-like metal-binding protein YciE
MPEEILKNTFANNAFEHFEIAAHKSLLSLADIAGMSSAKPLLEASLKEEEAVAVARSYVRYAQAA